MLEDMYVAISELASVSFQVSKKNVEEKKKEMFPPGIEPGTLRVWGARDNRYTTETLTGVRAKYIAYIVEIYLSQMAELRRDLGEEDIMFDFHIFGTR